MILTTCKHSYIYTKSKRMLKWFYRWLTTTDRTLYQIYKKPSQEKILIEDYIKSFIGADEYRILSNNIFNFTCGYKIVHNGAEYFCVHTWRNSFIISADDLTDMFNKQYCSDESLKIKTKRP